MTEAARILAEYERRRRDLPADRYSLARPEVWFAYTGRVRAALRLLDEAGRFPLAGRRALDVGCGSGDWLGDLAGWGVRAGDLAGIDLDPGRAAAAAARVPGADVRAGDASRLPWPDAVFDLVVLSTVVTSILDGDMRRRVAAESARVLRPGGAVLWYDFFYDNPWNSNVKGVGAAEIRSLYPGFAVRLRRVTLAPPLARRLVPWSWGVAHAAERLRLLDTHYLGLLAKPGQRR